MKSKYIDIIATTQIIGSIAKNPLILDQEEKYWFIEDDFPDEFHRVLFGTIFQIHQLGTKKISLDTITDYLSSRPHNNAVFIENKGEEFLLKATEAAQLASFDYYYNRMKKMTLLRAYDNIGFDLTPYYDIDNIMDIKKKEKQENWLDNTSLEGIANTIDVQISKIRDIYVNDDYTETKQAGKGIFDLVESLKIAPEVGIPLYGPLINTVTRGARLKKFYLRSAPSGYGKAIPNDTLIPTPSGFKKVKDIKPGDYLFDKNGKPTKVLQTHPQPEKKEIWKVYFKDGRIAECCKDHLWEYRYKSHSNMKYRVEPIEEIYNRTLKLKNGLKDDKGWRFAIRLNDAVEYSEKKFSIDPYVMGLFLGDGSFRYNSANKAISFSSVDEELPNSICNIMNWEFHKNPANYSYYFKEKNNLTHNLWVEEVLKDYPKLWNTKSEFKYIPKDYLLGSIKQRLSLLQGLLDTDGGIDEKGRVKFSTISPFLKDDVINLCRSLGFVATVSLDKRADKYSTKVCYSISIQCKKDYKPNLFRLKRKVDIANKYLSLTTGKKEEFKDHLAIVNIEKTSQKVEMTCFTVDNDDHLFLMNDYIVTHNTRANVADACYFACDKIYDEHFGWIKNGNKNPTLFIATEQDLSEIQTLALAFISNVDEAHILNGQYEEGEEERIQEAGRIIAESPLFIKEIPDFSIKDIENTIKKEIREHDISYVVFDYIHTSMKILEEITRRSGGVKLREDNILFMLSARLKDLCNLYGVFLLTSTQLSADWRDSKTPDQNLLRGAKSIADKIDYGSHILPVSEEDLTSLSDVLAQFPQVPNNKISVYKNRRGRYTGIYLWAYSDLGTCRIKPMFATDWSYNLINIDNIRVEEVIEESAF